MSTEDWVNVVLGAYVVVTSCVAAMYAACWVIQRRSRRPKPDPFVTNVEMVPGKAQLLLTRDGVVIARLILSEVRRDVNGTSAQFEDYYHFMEARRVR